MTVRKNKPTSPGRRFRTDVTYKELTEAKPLKKLTYGIKRGSGRAKGTISVRRKGGGAKRKYRIVDFKRDKRDIEATVASLEYDPNRSANIALLNYKDGEKRYILSPVNLKVGDKVIASQRSEISAGNSLPLRNIPVGVAIHNVELHPGRGGQLVRSAGGQTVIASKEGKYVQLKMPSGEHRLILSDCWATIGQISNVAWKNIKLGKAGRSRLMGRRPKVRGVAMHPGAHPHGGGEGRSGIGMPSPKSPWGKKTLGKKTRRRKHTDKYIVKDRRKK